MDHIDFVTIHQQARAYLHYTTWIGGRNQIGAALKYALYFV
jgi:hypothetical protein